MDCNSHNIPKIRLIARQSGPGSIQLDLNTATFKLLTSSPYNLTIENSLSAFVGAPDSLNNKVVISDSTVNINKSDGSLINSVNVPAEDLDFYNVADSAITVLNSLSNVVDSGNVKATESGNFTAPDGTYENSDSTFTDSVASGELNKLIPDIDLSVNSVVEGSVPSVKDIDIEVEDSLSNPITPTSVTMVGDVLTIEVPSYLPPTTGDYLVRFFDIDGTILKEERRNAGQDATAPANPNYDPTYLVFAEWNQPFTNVQNDIDVGAIYDTIDGKTYLFVRITDTTGLQPTLAINKTGTALLTVDWGDSTTDTSSTNGNFTLTKTAAYAAIGDYIITIESTDIYQNSTATTLFNGDNAYARTLLKAYMGVNMRMSNNGIFRFCNSLKIVSLNKNSGNGNNYGLTFNNCHSIIHINIPSVVEGFSNSHNNCYSLKSVSIPALVTFYNGAFNGCNSLESVIITGCNNLFGNSPFSSCNSLPKIKIPNATTNIVTSTFFDCHSLSEVIIGNATTTLGNSAFQTCRSVKSFEFPSTLTTIGSNVFNGNSATLEYTFLSTTPPTLANTNAFTGINAACKIYVPDASVAAYKAATNWSTYANYIYPLSTKP